MACLAATLDLKTEKVNAHSRVITSVDFSPDGSKIVSGSYDETIKVWGEPPVESNCRMPTCRSHGVLPSESCHADQFPH